jgi:hypothetical protein
MNEIILSARVKQCKTATDSIELGIGCMDFGEEYFEGIW